ncbi:NACHT domain-containing protein [Umezawaea endophytica]|uniref:NACHT domain-containing protein n=1 Tax=Umezawaea endophytica TaxID=1654476 RepID=A0A9X2VWN9_9PSEU|nr:NACHT domain-containing protein [Umezawaea endophytica]MCS7484039.1 NACHT domain-containing protein [Umezawaea endophytica]
MTGVVETALGRAAVQASKPLLEPLLAKFKRNLAQRGYGPADVLTLLERIPGPHSANYWPASLLELLPHGVTQRQVDAFTKTPEFATCARQAIAVAIMNAEPVYRNTITTSLTLSIAPHVPGVSRERITPYVQAFADHLLEASRGVARKLRDSIGNSQELITWAESTIVSQTLASIDKYATTLVAQKESHGDYRKWVDDYRKRFAEAHRMIDIPDLGTRREVAYTELFVEPTIREIDSETLLFRTTRSKAELVADEVGFTTLTRQAVLLGDPGAGKSTASTILAVTAAETGQAVPFIVVLRHVGTPEFSITGLLCDQLSTHHQVTVPRSSVERLLHEGEALLVFDGLDEIPRGADRVRIARTIEGISRAYPYTRVVVTSRIIGYPIARLNPAQFNEYAICAFDRAQVDDYVDKWFRNQTAAGRWTTTEIASRFKRETATLNDLVTNPLLLAFICILYRGRKTIPRTRARLYSRCVELLLGEWDKTREIIDEVPDLELLQITLSRIASLSSRLEKASPRLTSRVIEEDLVPFLLQEGKGSAKSAAAFVRDLLAICRGRAWIFTDVGLDVDHEEVFAFTHASFREYFEALYLIRNCANSAELAEHLWPHATSGRAEVYAQICVSLHNIGNAAGGSEVVLSMLAALEEKLPLPDPDLTKTSSGVERESLREAFRRQTVLRESVLMYVVKMSDCVPMSRAALQQLLGYTVRQVPVGRVGAMSLVLESSYHHKDVVIELLGELLRGSVGREDDQDRLVYLWFAIHAGYLADSVEDGLSTQAVKALRAIVQEQLPFVERLTANRGELGYAIRCQAGALPENAFASGTVWSFVDKYTDLFQCFDQLIPSVGPQSVATWVLDSLSMADRGTAPVAAAMKLLRAVATGVEQHGPVFENLLMPTRAATGNWDIGGQFEEVLERSCGYPLACREGLLYLATGCVELAELWQNDRGTSRERLYEWARVNTASRHAVDYLERWSTGALTVWKTESQGVS